MKAGSESSCKSVVASTFCTVLSSRTLADLADQGVTLMPCSTDDCFVVGLYPEINPGTALYTHNGRMAMKDAL